MLPIKKANNFIVAFRGMKYLFKDYNFKIHLPAGVLAIISGVYLQIEAWEWGFLFSAIFGVWISEGFNTCIERVCDFVHPEFNDKIGYIKDLSAGCVLLTVFYALVVSLIIVHHHFSKTIYAWI